jgi:acyl-CoA thioesterase FadM
MPSAHLDPDFRIRLRPRHDGANIRIWIGFKQFMSLAEEAVLGWFRDHGMGPQALFSKYGLGLEIAESSVLLPDVLEIDDEVLAEVTQNAPGQFTVRLVAERDGIPATVLRCKMRIVLVREKFGPESPEPCPPELSGLVVPELTGSLSATTGPDARAFTHDWRVRYYHCHYSDRVRHMTYAGVLEDVVDRALAARGIGIPRMLAERSWIPVVSRVKIRLLADAHMDEVVRTTFSVGDIIGGKAFDGRMDCYALADGPPRPVATATILHGYAVTEGALAGSLAEFDAATIAALRG